MRSVALLAPLSLSFTLVACYGSAPPRPPRVPLPPIEEGAALEVHSETNTTIENVAKTAWSCPAGHAEGDAACTKTTYSEAEPVTRTNTTASIGDQPLSAAQFKVITDPKWNDKLGELDDLSHKCTRANVPRYIGIGLMAAGLLVGEIMSSQGSSAGPAVLYGGAAAGGVSYAVGYFAYGGRDCNTARALFNYLDTTNELGETTVPGADAASEMKVLAEQFNATHGAHASRETRNDRLRMRE
ncbi:MAG TPA: hypothetical protein VGF94_22950 [Kofleriaceae bacterium]|jgi:hypothetical protein